ncbi:hypothetical protein [Nostoc sp. UHCC 0251]|uniref:hypothetical protein n=1 Tax=Nostoc sp. UHCC 0251 TaxID=3110240 RepID=UPI002B1F2CB9|nr:hypothetical protein [Nostoc sp. UHCC 0251]MEA5625296.1 hypothetical protein [Nostoc sp. UHCC 0251]
MTDKQVQERLEQIRLQLLKLQNEMIEGGYGEESIGVECLTDIMDEVGDTICFFGVEDNIAA